MFEQIGNPDMAEKKTWKERLAKGALIMGAISIVLGSLLLYALS